MRGLFVSPALSRMEGPSFWLGKSGWLEGQLGLIPSGQIGGPKGSSFSISESGRAEKWYSAS